MLDQSMLDSIRGIFASLKAHYTLSASVRDDSHGKQLEEMCREVASVSEQIDYTVEQADFIALSLLKEGKPTGIVFRGVPGGHEFTSLLLAILNADGQGKNLPDGLLQQRIAFLKTPIKLTTYASLSCTNCPEVVQSLNLMALYNPGIEHEMVDGAIYKDEVEALGINAVPAVYANGEQLHVGQSNLGNLLIKLEEKMGVTEQAAVTSEPQIFDLIVVGGGPAGSASAIYSARKGLRVALVAERVGGQVNETTGIENIPSVNYTTGMQLAADLRKHVEDYSITLFDGRRIDEISALDDHLFQVKTIMGEQLRAMQVILATGARWRRLDVPGEEQYIGRGVAFCPHCDGPFFKGKSVAVVGGGNSGVEAAIDLAGICSKVTVLEFMPELKADKVLREKLFSLPNVEVHTNVATQEVLGDGQKVNGVRIKDRTTGEVHELALDGVFVQIGLAANTSVFDGLVERNRAGEIIVDERCRTSRLGLYAAGDCTTVPYKQIVIAMGEGAKAALTAFDDRIRQA